MRYFIHLGFDGTRYSGWQKQDNTRNTVQEIVEHTLQIIFKKNIVVYGCGRTDAGVHASRYILHINLDEAPAFDLKYRLNKNLPDDIAVFDVVQVSENQHARYSAISRTYDYFIHLKKDPVLIRYSNFYEDVTLDIEMMKQACALIQATTDCKPLCKQPELYDNTLCQISACTLFVNEDQGRMRFTITSNRFLRGMVRYCIYFLVKVGSGELTLDEFKSILNQETLLTQKQPALPHGLFLSHVEYPFLSFQDSHQLIRWMKTGLE